MPQKAGLLILGNAFLIPISLTCDQVSGFAFELRCFNSTTYFWNAHDDLTNTGKNPLWVSERTPWFPGHSLSSLVSSWEPQAPVCHGQKADSFVAIRIIPILFLVRGDDLSAFKAVLNHFLSLSWKRRCISCSSFSFHVPPGLENILDEWSPLIPIKVYTVSGQICSDASIATWLPCP